LAIAAAVLILLSDSGAQGPSAPARAPGIDALARTAHSRYTIEATGATVHQKLNAVARAPALIRALEGGNPAAIQAAAYHQQAGTHQHISHLVIIRGGRVLADSGVPFCVRGPSKVIRDRRGRTLGTLQVTVQDVIGFVRYVHRNVHVNVVVRGRGPAHQLTSWKAAARVRLPDSGDVQIGPRRYPVRSFTEKAFGGEPIKVWIIGR
jgi:hypothetical protein